MSRVVLLINGPNLSTLGTREPDIYGTTTLPQIEQTVTECLADGGLATLCVQHDAEAELIAVLRDHADSAGAILNPGALMMDGWGLRDALASYRPPWIEVHLSNLWAREQFRHTSVLAPLASGIIVGFGADGYRLAAEALLDILARDAP